MWEPLTIRTKRTLNPYRTRRRLEIFARRGRDSSTEETQPLFPFVSVAFSRGDHDQDRQRDQQQPTADARTASDLGMLTGRRADGVDCIEARSGSSGAGVRAVVVQTEVHLGAEWQFNRAAEAE
jgi:hypothetical protein